MDTLNCLTTLIQRNGQPPSHQSELTNSTIDYIANGLLPQSAVGNKYFCKILNLAELSLARFAMPSHRHLSQKLIAQHMAIIKVRMTREQKCRKFNTSILLRTSVPAGTCKLFGYNWPLYFKLWTSRSNGGMRKLQGKTHSRKLFHKYDNTTTIYNIINKACVIVTDNTVNAVKAFTRFTSGGSWQWHRWWWWWWWW